MQQFTTILLIALSTACTTDVDSASPDETPTGRRCGTSGSASISGTVAGESISAVRAAKIKLDADGFVVLSLDEAPGATCGDAGPTGEHLVFGFCSDPAVGMHSLGGSSSFACPGGAFAIVEQNEGEDLADATGGSITIASSDDDCTSGSFAVDFGSERLTGTFDAVACP
jgi:hypothetical protein